MAADLAEIPGLKLRPDAPLARLTTFRIGGPAELLVEVGSGRALSDLLRAARRAGAPFHLLGLGSNVLIPDQGLPGIVVRLGGEFKDGAIEADLGIANGELGRVHSHGDPAGSGVEVVARQRPLVLFIERA